MEKAAEQKLVMSDTEEVQLDFDDMFPMVEASKLSLDDEFLKHEPETSHQASIKEIIIEGIKSGMSDFRHPFVDPSINEEKDIVFEKGKEPATGHTLKWWKMKAKGFMLNKNSRIGTKREYCVFLGVLIKSLIEQGYTISDAWKEVCDDSKNLGHHRDSFKAKKHAFELTGSRQVVKWYDLANTFKILTGDDGKGVFIASGYYYTKGDEYSLGNVDQFYFSALSTFEASVAWIVLDV